MVEVTRLLSNLIKSGFIAFSQDNKLIIDTNQSKVIQNIDLENEKMNLNNNASVEEALAEALIEDADLGDFEDDDLLTMDAADLQNLNSDASEETKQIASELVATANDEAKTIVSKAHDEAEALRAEAFDEAVNIKQQAKDEGYQAGYEEGIGKASQEIEEERRQFELEKTEFQNEMIKQQEQLIIDTEHKMVDILCQLIPSITGVVIDGQKDALLYMINSAMRDLDNSTQFVIKVSSQDYELVAEQKDEIYGALNPNIKLEVFEDAKLSPMQCIIETDNGLVDVSLDIQLENLKKALQLIVQE